MKILYLSFVDISLPKGPSVNEREFVLALAKHPEVDAKFVIPKPRQAIEDKLPNTHITYISQAIIQQIPKWIKQQKEAVKAVGNLAAKESFDFMIIRGGIFAFAIRKIVRNSGIPYAMKTAGSGKFNIFKSKNFLIKTLYPLNQKIFKEVINNAFAVDVVSEIQKESLEKITGAYGKIYFVDNGVNTDRFFIKDKETLKRKLSLEKFDQIIGYVGGSPWERGGLQIIEAMPELLKAYPKMGGVIVGGGDKMNILYDKAKELNVEEHIAFIGVVPFDEVNEYINTFDIGISQLYSESQGASEQKVRQYLACGKPVIVSPGAVNNFIPKEGLGYIVEDPYSIKEFADKVRFILESDLYRNTNSSEVIRDYAIANLSVDSRLNERLAIYKKYLEI